MPLTNSCIRVREVSLVVRQTQCWSLKGEFSLQSSNYPLQKKRALVESNCVTRTTEHTGVIVAVATAWLVPWCQFDDTGQQQHFLYMYTDRGCIVAHGRIGVRGVAVPGWFLHGTTLGRDGIRW